MPSMGPSFFILGFVVASVTADETSTFEPLMDYDNLMFDNNSSPMNIAPSVTTSTITNITSDVNMDSISFNTSTMNITNIMNSTITPTKQEGDDQTPQNTTPKMYSATSKPTGPPKSASTTKTKDNGKDKGDTAEPLSETNDSTGIIILVVIILVAFGFGVACYFARKRGRRYSVDFTSRPDEANIPLSTIDPEMPVEPSQNGLQTFESPATTTEEPQEPETKPEVQEEQKAEADESVVEPSAESAAPAPSPDSSEDKPKEDVTEQSPPAPVEPSVEEKTDDEGVVSNKTSVESLKETNENNSNNADFSQQRDLMSSNLFWDVPLDCPV